MSYSIDSTPMKKPLLFVATAMLISFGAGWFLRPSLDAGDVSNQRNVTTSSGTNVPAPTIVPKPKTSVAPAEPDAEAAPFSSWSEVVQFISDGDFESDPLFVQQAIARLLMTSTGAIEQILDESIGSATVPAKPSVENPVQKQSKSDYPFDEAGNYHEEWVTHKSSQTSRSSQGQEPQEQAMARTALVFRWTMLAPAQATAFAVAHVEIQEIQGIIPYLLTNLARTNPAAAEAMLQQVPSDQRAGARKELDYAKALKDPLAFLQDPGNKELLAEESDLQQRIIRSWAKTSPMNAAAWFQLLPFDATNSSTGEIILARWLKKDAAAAQTWVEGFPDADMRHTLAQAYGVHIAQTTAPDKLVETLQKLPSSLAEQAMEAAFANWPSEAAKSSEVIYLNYVQAHPDAAASCAAMLVSDAFKDDPSGQSAIAIIGKLPDGSAKETAVSSLVGNWIDEDKEAASAWVNSLPPGSAKDQGSSRIADSILAEDPTSALAWAMSIQTAEIQQQKLTIIYRHWLQTDPFSAAESLKALPLEFQERIGFRGKKDE